MSRTVLWQALSKYSQCDSIRAWLPGERAKHTFDGVGLCWFAESAGADAGPTTLPDSEGVEMLLADELKAFEKPVSQCSVLAEETVIREGSGPIKLFACARKVPQPQSQSPQSDFTAQLRRFAHLLNDAFDATQLYRISVCIPVDASSHAASDIHCDGILELSFGSIESATSLITSPEYQGAKQTVAAVLIPAVRLIATHENMLFDPASGIDRSQELISAHLNQSSVASTSPV